MRTRLLKCVSVQMKASIFSLLSGLGKTGKIHQLTSLLAEMVELNTPTNVCKTDLMEKEVRSECKNYKMHMSRRQVWNKLLRAGVCKNEIDGIPTAELIKRWNTIRAKTDRGSLNQPWSNLNKRPYSGYPRHAVPLHEKSSWWRAPPLSSRGPDSHECKEWGSDWKQKQSRAFVSVDGRMQMPLGNSIKPSDKRGLGAGCTDEKHVTVPPKLFLGNGYLGRDSANSVGEKCSPVVHSPTMPVSQMQNRLPERLEKVETRPAESNQFKGTSCLCLGEQTVQVNPKDYHFTNTAAKEEKTPPAPQDNKPADIPEPVREMGKAKNSPTQRATLSTIDSRQSPAKSTSLKERQSDQIQRNCERDFILSGHVIAHVKDYDLMEKSKQKACSTCAYVEKWHLTNKGQEDCAAQRFGHGQETDLIASRDANHYPAKETASGDTEMTTCNKGSQKPLQMDSNEQICALSLLGTLWGWDGYKKHPIGNISPNEALLNSMNAMLCLCFTGWSLVNHISQKLLTDMRIIQT